MFIGLYFNKCILIYRENDWDEQAIETFETLTHCAQWKVLMARVESYYGGNELDGRVVPCIKLVDTNSEKVIF